MEREPYHPVSCDTHDQLEAAAMHNEHVELEFELEGVPQREVGTVDDVYTSDGAEYIRFRAGGGPLEIRLDRIISMRRA
jgi:transcriptional antiterminator Rof (Rho-off)